MKKTTLLLWFLFFISTSMVAQDSLKTQQGFYSDWKFRVGTYFWFINIKGNIVRPPEPTNLPEYREPFDVDLSFEEVQTLLKFAFLLNGNYRGEHIVATLNSTSFILEGDALTPRDIVLQNAHYRLGTAFGEALVGYRILKKPKIQLDGLLGAKIIHFDIQARSDVGGTLPFEGVRARTWIEPIIATRFKYIPHHRWEFALYLDYGPIRKQDELTNQYAANVNFLANKWLYLSLGYRHWLFRAQNEESIFNGQFYGMLLKLGAQF